MVQVTGVTVIGGKIVSRTFHSLPTMSQKLKLKNAKLRAHQHVKSIIDSILEKVSEAIDIRTTAGKVVLDIVEDAMKISNETILDFKLLKSSRERIAASLRHDWLVIDYRRNPIFQLRILSTAMYTPYRYNVQKCLSWKRWVMM